MSDTSATISEYEVFRNERNALAFFFFRNPILDQNAAEGPFWFSTTKDSITAGTEEHHIFFDALKPDIIEIAKQRGVIMLMEFEGQTPVRCTPCYLTETF
jgi:hypothetical protein